jgi:pimeloyl-ACP methyl ester carboxylesterase
VRLAHEERGSGAPLVLVHGTASTRASWDELLELVSGSFRTVRYDRRGYGASSELGATRVEHHGDDLIELVRELGAGPALVCGHSFGALVALDVLLREPELVRAAVLVEPPMLWLASSGAEAMARMHAAREEVATVSGAVAAITRFSLELCGQRGLAAAGRERGEESLRHPRAFAADLEAAASWSVAPADLESIAKPVVLVAGVHTAAHWREPSEALARLIPGAALHEADSAHLVPIEAPEVVAGAIWSLAQP